MAYHIGQRLSYDGALCTVRYIGPVKQTTGEWLGVEWDDPSRGKHSGQHKDTRYFECISSSPTAASFVRPSRPALAPQSFISAVLEKYTSEIDRQTNAISAAKQIRIGTKTALEVGFDKIRRQLARVEELKIIIVDSYRVSCAVGPGDKSVAETVPAIRELDLGRNLIETVGVVVDICRELPELRSLRVGGNRFRNVLADEALRAAGDVFSKVKELALNENLMTWEEITCITQHFPTLLTLNCGTNQLSVLPELSLGSLTETLTSLNLELNHFTSLSDIAVLSKLKALRNLHLKGNRISSIAAPGAQVPVFSESLQYLDVSYNEVTSWAFVDGLLTSTPGLLSLRLAHNPVYEANASGGTNQQTRIVSEESHMVTIGRLAQIRTLNFVSIAPDDRANAEMFYLSRIARDLASVTEDDLPGHQAVLAQHPRYEELCGIYGAPDVVRRKQINTELLEARLVAVTFYTTADEAQPQTVVRRIPKSFDMYAVKSVAGRLFGMAPTAVKLTWETGEWDPVAALDEVDEMALLDEEYSSDEEDAEADREGDAMDIDTEEKQDGQDRKKMGRWVKREVELKDGTRQLGFCVDGTEVRVRVERQ
ncbi:hypothetical protein TD95_003170 [Thielaviopsis punctulata]|uniref:CAP-Gly domain-containing protein n=1 Tax=Thielaviopsis punctulata TaxID=72032 RepID=A0A0F4ZBM1_9PEZI|nr:hypothetical protein TD95_003170 [Thielaviopsis punctulata]